MILFLLNFVKESPVLKKKLLSEAQTGMKEKLHGELMDYSVNKESCFSNVVAAKLVVKKIIFVSFPD